MRGLDEAPALVDVNVPMYAAGRPHRFKDACAWLMVEITEGRFAAAVDAEAVQEILYRYGALQRWDVAVTMATSVLDIMPIVYPVHVADVRRAVELFGRYAPLGVAARDLIHVAVMQNNGVSRIVSTDEHFDLVEGITRLDPLRLFQQRAERA